MFYCKIRNFRQNRVGKFGRIYAFCDRFCVKVWLKVTPVCPAMVSELPEQISISPTRLAAFTALHTSFCSRRHFNPCEYKNKQQFPA